MNRIELQQALITYFNAEELIQICFEMHIDHEQFTKTPRIQFTRELVEFCEREGRLETLQEQIHNKRPHLVPPPAKLESEHANQIVAPTSHHKPVAIYKRLTVVVAAALLILVVLFILSKGMVWPSQSNAVLPGPPPSLPADPVVYSANLANCEGAAVKLDGVLKTALETATADSGARPVGVEQWAAPDWQENESDRLIMTLYGRCLEGNGRVITITFPAPAANRVHLLNEPAQVAVIAEAVYAEDVVKAAVLYASGQYDASYRMITERAASYFGGQSSSMAGMESFFWFWGNVLLRQDRWVEAIEVYKRALADPLLTESDRLAIQHNRALAALLPVWAQRDSPNQVMNSQERTVCREVGLIPLEDILGEGNSCTTGIQCAQMQVLIGELLLHCPRTSQLDTDRIQAINATQIALSLYPFAESAPALALRADIGLVHPGDEQYGNTKTIHQSACEAIKRDPALPDAHYILSVVYAWHGQKQQARTELNWLLENAPLLWQRQLAGRMLEHLPAARIKGVALPSTCP